MWLVHEKDFNEKSVKSFLNDLRATFEFAKLDSELDTENNDGNETPEETAAKIAREALGKPKLPIPGMKTEVITIGAAQATISWPATCTHTEYEDLKYWLEGVLRKAKRDIGASDNPLPKIADTGSGD